MTAAGRLANLLLGGVAEAARDTMGALETLLAPDLPGRPGRAAAALGGLAVAWVVYVPLHELLHAAGCVLSGGRVWSVSLSPIYGGGWLAEILPFVTPSWDEPARLTGYSTGGSDLRHLVTDLFPYLPTVLIGVPLLKRWGGSALAFGPAVVLGLAPFVSLPGDYFEIGAILVTSILPERFLDLRSDDLFATMASAARSGSPARAAVVTLSFAAGLILAGWTWRLGSSWASTVSRTPLRGGRAPRGPAR